MGDELGVVRFVSALVDAGEAGEVSSPAGEEVDEWRRLRDHRDPLGEFVTDQTCGWGETPARVLKIRKAPPQTFDKLLRLVIHDGSLPSSHTARPRPSGIFRAMRTSEVIVLSSVASRF